MSRRALALIFGAVTAVVIIGAMAAAMKVAGDIADRFADIGPELPATAKFLIRLTNRFRANFFEICGIVVAVCFVGAWVFSSFGKKRRVE